jgi:hypothetical protein
MEEERITDELAEQVWRDAGPADSPRRPDWLAERLDADDQLSEEVRVYVAAALARAQEAVARSRRLREQIAARRAKGPAGS